MARHRVAATRRDDEAEQILSTSLVPLTIKRIAEPQRLRLDMTAAALNRVVVGYNAFGTDTFVDTGTVEDKFILSAGYDPRRPSYFEIDDQRFATSAQNGIAMSPTRRVLISRPANSGMIGAVLPAALLAERMREVTGKDLKGPIVLDPSIDLRRGPGKLFGACLQDTLQELEVSANGTLNPLRQALLGDLLVSVVLNLPGNHLDVLADDRPAAVAPAVVRRAEDYMAAHFREPITLSELVRICGCSRSALTQAFRASRGYSAMEFLAACRLDDARRRFEAEPAATVTDVALACGFSNQGRFAKAYQKRFGELPSETRARSHAPWWH